VKLYSHIEKISHDSFVDVLLCEKYFCIMVPAIELTLRSVGHDASRINRLALTALGAVLSTERLLLSL